MKPGPYRLPHGGLIDRKRPLSFTFDGQPLTGLEGDTLASALLANGVRVVARSFKFHRPRGIFSAGLEEPHALVQLGAGARAIPSARATLVPLTEGLEAHSQSGWPRVSFDALRALDFVSPLFAAGFYNKMFTWPNWHAYEPMIRKLAGLGRSPLEPDPDRYDERNVHCDVLVVGAGVAGLRAALLAARAGQRVILADSEARPGGQASWDGSVVDREPARLWIDRALAELEQRAPDVRVLPRTLAVACYDHHVVTLLETCAHDPVARQPATRERLSREPACRERLWTVRTSQLILATGAIEQPLIFANNDRPGVMLAGAARKYLACHAVAPGSRIVIATNNDSVYPLARELRRAGIAPQAILDSRPRVSHERLAQMQALSIRVHTGCLPLDTSGFAALTSVKFGRIATDAPTDAVAQAGTDSTTHARSLPVSPHHLSIRNVERLPCDALLVSGGWNPALHLFAQARGRLTFRETSKTLEPATTGSGSAIVPGIDIVGIAAGDPTAAPVGPRIAPGRSSRQWVDLLHDVTVSDLELAQRENYRSIEHIKRFTTVGMAADQGKTSTTASLEVIAHLRSARASDLGHTTLRPPLAPVTLGALAGRAVGERFAPSRHTPLHEWHSTHGAVMENYGEWRRPAIYLRGMKPRRDAESRRGVTGSSLQPAVSRQETVESRREAADQYESAESRYQAIRHEARMVRDSVGLFDGSSLGKIEIHGPDALQFLDRFYINNLATLKPGRARYGIMLRESGVIFDDGTVVMLAPDRFLITTTSGNAGRVHAWLEEWHQCEWPELRVAILPVTDQWATITLTGPKSREVLTKLATDIDLSNAAFPHLGMREGRLLGFPTRIYRVSFTGELTYEINVPSSAAPTLWDALLRLGWTTGLQPIGLEALLLLRLEKGFLHIGTDTDGSTVPDDVGWGKVAAAKTADYIGKRSLQLPENLRTDRLQLVGLRRCASTVKGKSPSPMGEAPIIVGSHVRLEASALEGPAEATDGWVTSAGRTVLTDEPIALVQLRAGRRHIGQRITVHDAGTVTHATVVSPPFWDVAGERMNG
jgi:sarcosine oxidase subunit alpha